MTRFFAQKKHELLKECLPVLLLIALGVFSITATYSKLSNFYDEPPHVAAGMQWWNEHRFSFEPKHPPFPRLMAAAPLYAVGKQHVLAQRVPNEDPGLDFWLQGSDLLYADHSYRSNLALARVGVLPFYVLSCLLVYFWSVSLFGQRAALLSLASYVTLPVVAGHAGVAMTDMPHAAMLLLGLMVMLRWLKLPSVANSLWLGLSLALMVCTKLSALLHWPVAMAFMLAANYAAQYWRLGKPAFVIGRTHGVNALYVIAVFAFVVPAMFFFSWQDMRDGLLALIDQNSTGHAIWLFEPLHNKGVWYFFPVVYFFKTPIAFLISNVLSTARTWMSVQRFGLSVERLFPVLGVLAVFVCNMFSNINVGLRHALPVYPLFAVSAGYGLLWLWQRRKNMAVALAMRSALCAVLAWQVYDFTAAYPERTAYYNIMATALTDGNPERISPDSDVESGQGFFQLAEVIKRRGIKKMMGCFWLGGSIRRLNEDLPIRLDKCALKTPVHGWLVVSRMHKLVRVERTTWLNQYQPIENIGKTLLLYYIE